MKKRNKVSAEFSMSSLTDIIFLLLIFFMLTSTLVKLDTVDLPESNSQTVAPTSIVVTIPEKGSMKVNGNTVRSVSKVKSEVRGLLAKQSNKKDATITIVAEKNVPFRKTQEIMQIASDLRMRAIVATKPIE